MNAALPLRDYRLPPAQVPPTVVETLSQRERDQCLGQIKQRLREQNAVVVAHYYTHPDLQRLADETGGCVSDSLDMARFGHETDAATLIVCGVRFMGETAKILNPEKRVLMPDLHADCSLDLGCPADEFGAFCDRHPDHTVVVYANTSAAVKARADWMVTSGSAVEVVKGLAAAGQKIIWAPDKYLGEYVREQSGAEMILWQGSCVVHEEFKGRELAELRQRHPRAKVLAHPESPASVLDSRCGELHHRHHQGRQGAGRGRLHRRHRQGHFPQAEGSRADQAFYRGPHRRQRRHLQELRPLPLDGHEQPDQAVSPA